MSSLLIVDDDRTICRGLEAAIKSSNIYFDNIYIASNGKEAVTLIREKRPLLVLLDIKMPEMDGLEVLKTIELLDIKSKVIILSGYSEFDYAQKSMRHGAVDYLLKPVRRDELTAAFKRCLGAEFKEADEQKVNTNENGIKTIRIIKSYINENYNSDISLSLLAEIVKMNPSYLSALFKNEEKINISRYIAEVRVKKAMELLSDPAIRVNEAARLTGFKNEKYFTSIFKRLCGMTPKEFKRL